MSAELRAAFRHDLARWTENDRHTPLLASMKLIMWPGIQAVLLLRAQLSLQAAGHMRLARIVSLVNLRLTGAEFLVGCRVGPGLVIRHPQGLVIGSGAVIGDDCTILQHVTLGERYGDGADIRHEYPCVGSNVVIGAGAVLLGGIMVGDGAVVGANAVVVRNVDARDVVVGAPARSTRKLAERPPV